MSERLTVKTTMGAGSAVRASLSAAVCLLSALTCTGSVVAQTAGAEITGAEITPFEIEYEVGNNLINAGSAKLSLSRQGDEWIYSLNTTPSGIFKLTGKGKIQEIAVMNVTKEKNLQTKRYTFRQDAEERRSVDAWFNWDNKELTYKKRGEETVEKINDPILDRLSVTLAIMEQLRTGFERAELQVFDNGRVKTVVFDNEGTEVMNTNLGQFPVVRVRSYNKEGDRRRETITWFAPALEYVPVMFEQIKSGKLVARLKITKLEK